jgi:UDP-3-O-[3-hydroxymyristoyl] N-acetylglucosamine deacetylase
MPRIQEALMTQYHNLDCLRRQQTIATPIVFVGIGLHSGERATMRLQPAEADHGVTLRRRDLPARQQAFAVHWEAVRGSTLCTAIGNLFGHEVSTIEHLLSALAALGIDNVAIELDGPEIPIMDGSALPFVEALDNAGIAALGARREVIVVRRPVRIQQGASWAELLPDPGRRITVSIDFQAQVIGTQTISIDLTPDVYRREIAPARTFGFADQIDQLWRRGLALGGSIKNAILVREGRVANLEGLRFRDEFVRHKVLDVVGDLALAGAPIIGHYRGNRPGHQLNTDLVALLMDDQDAWERVPVEAVDEVLAGNQLPEKQRGLRPETEQGQVRPVDGRRLLQHPLADRIRQLLGSSQGS